MKFVRNKWNTGLTQDAKPEKAAKPGRGRPRDPAIEERVFAAAIAIYAAGGWTEFHFDAIARHTGVGKAALYRRWKSRGDLLREMLETCWFEVKSTKTGNLRDDLTALARMCFDMLSGPHGDVVLHLRLDAERFEEVRAVAAPYTGTLVRQARLLIRSAIVKGEIPGSVNPGLILDVVVGGVTNHIASTPKHLFNKMFAKRDQFISDLVDLVLEWCRNLGLNGHKPG
jgi:AcrR family transcriptional regulator